MATILVAASFWGRTSARSSVVELSEHPASLRSGWIPDGRQTMSRGFPSMTALLGLLAIAGYQNRDKIAELINGLGKGAPAPGGLGGLLGGLGASGPGGLLSGGLKELVDHFRANGQGDAVNSWVGT